MNDNTNHIQNLVDKLAEEAETREWEVQAHDGESVSVLVAPSDIRATDVQAIADKYAAIPRSRAGKVQAFDVSSFAALVLRDYDAGSVIFADVGGAGVVFEACLDYHQATANQAEREGQRHGREIITYAPKLSKEWQAWTGQAGKAMSQGEFAAWIEDHLPDIADPRHLLEQPTCTAAKLGEVYGFNKDALWGYADPEKLARVSEGLSIRESAQVKNAVNLASGEVSLTYVTEHTDSDGRPLNVPKRFLLSIPVFEREAGYLVPVKLAYRKSGGAIVWTFELFRPDRFRDDAIAGTVEGIKKALTPAATVEALNPGPVVPVMMAKRA